MSESCSPFHRICNTYILKQNMHDTLFGQTPVAVLLTDLVELCNVLEVGGVFEGGDLVEFSRVGPQVRVVDDALLVTLKTVCVNQ